MLADIVSAVFVVAIIYMLVRPKSASVDMVNLLTDALSGIVATATKTPE